MLTRWLTFKGFNGTDDLHYAMLSSNMLKGKFDAFNANDIFSGRVLLIALQALIYFAVGVNIFTTQAGTLAATVFCCYLIIFKLAKYKTFNEIIFACSIFYFNPVLNEATLGAMPDIYVLLAGILVFLLWQKISAEENKRKNFVHSVLCGLIIFAAMFFKENAIIYIPFILIASLLTWQKKIFFSLVTISTFLLLVIAAGFVYQHYTNDFFFRLHQIQNSSYENPCNYTSQPSSALIERLTYGEFKEFVTASFYPVILAFFLLFANIFFNKNYKLKDDSSAKYFIVLLLLGLYFPFSFTDYQPLCINARHFIFLLPFAIMVCTSFFQNLSTAYLQRKFFIIASLIILIICVINTGEKWYWMVYGLLFAFFAIAALQFRLFIKIQPIFFAATLWVYMPYHLFFQNSDWFKNLQTIAEKTSGNYFYFPEHDNMMHWQLLHGYNDSIHCYNLEKFPFMIFQKYYEPLDTKNFHAGWLIINNAYTTRSEEFLHRINVLNQMTFLPKKICDGDICAYYIDMPERLITVQQIIEGDVKTFY